MRHQRNLQRVQTCSEPAQQQNIVVAAFGLGNQDSHRQAIEIRPLNTVETARYEAGTAR